MYEALNSLTGYPVSSTDNDTLRNAIANCGLLVEHNLNDGVCKVDAAKWDRLGPDEHVKVVEILQWSQDQNDSAHTDPDVNISIVPVAEEAEPPKTPDDLGQQEEADGNASDPVAEEGEPVDEDDVTNEAK